MISDAPPINFISEERQAHTLLRDLHAPRRATYWFDLILTSTVGWGAFAIAARTPLSLKTVAPALISMFALYRGLCFLHEISHINKRSLKGFETVWNLLIGFPLLMPSFMYTGVHQSHHMLGSYGTSEDPEYLPFAKSAPMTLVFAFESFLIPVALIVRFLFLSVIGLLIPRFQTWLAIHASSLTMNFAFRRQLTPGLVKKMRLNSMMMLLLWVSAVVSLPLHIFELWLAVFSVASFINTLRTLAAHKYESDGTPLDRRGQLCDSHDVPGAVWTALWAPVGLRYHALHHYFPGIPYHNLGEAHRRLVRDLPDNSLYRSTINSGLLASLTPLITGSRTAR